jgi:hypothetical protein
MMILIVCLNLLKAYDPFLGKRPAEIVQQAFSYLTEILIFVRQLLKLRPGKNRSILTNKDFTNVAAPAFFKAEFHTIFACILPLFGK